MKNFTNFNQMFETNVALYPDKPALVIYQPDHQIEIQFSYLDINKQANRIAHFLLAKNTDRPLDNKLIAIVSNQPQDFVIIALAAHKAGAAFTHIASTDEIKIAKLQTSKPDYIFINGNNDLDYKQNAFQLTEIYNDLTLSEDNPKLAAPRPEDLAYVMFTSGTSSGVTKPIDLEHRGIKNCILSQVELLNLKPEDKMLHISTVGFGAHLDEIFLCLTVGATLYAMTPCRHEELAGFIERYKITHAIFVPSVLNLLRPAEVSSLKYVLVVGDNCPLELLKSWIFAGKIVKVGYGTSEYTICVSLANTSLDMQDIPAGMPIAGTHINLVEFADQQAEEGETAINQLNQELKQISEQFTKPAGEKRKYGRLYLAGEGLARGYRNNTEETAKSFYQVKSPIGETLRVFRTSDIAKEDDGQLYLIGRLSNLIKLHGQRIHPELVEKKLLEYEVAGKRVFSQAVVFDINVNEQYLCALLVPFDATYALTKIEKMAIQAFLTQCSLPHYCVPRIYKTLSEKEITKNANGKIDRLKCKQILQQQLADHSVTLDSLFFSNETKQGNKNTIDTLSSTMQELIKIWKEVLPVSPEYIIRPEDSFTQKGGSSMHLIQLRERLKNKINFFPNCGGLLRDNLFKYNTLQQMHNFLVDKPTDNSLLVEMQPGDADLPTLIFFHSITGDPTADYRELSNELAKGERLRILGVKAKPVSNSSENDDINTLTELLAKQIIEKLADSPHAKIKPKVILAGWSYGVIFTVLVAANLTRQGYSVECILIDGIAPTCVPADKIETHKENLAKILTCRGIQENSEMWQIAMMNFQRVFSTKIDFEFVPSAKYTLYVSASKSSESNDYASISYLQKLLGDNTDPEVINCLGWPKKNLTVIKIDDSTHFQILHQPIFLAHIKQLLTDTLQQHTYVQSGSSNQLTKEREDKPSTIKGQRKIEPSIASNFFQFVDKDKVVTEDTVDTIETSSFTKFNTKNLP